jgi:hypothetical protein
MPPGEEPGTGSSPVSYDSSPLRRQSTPASSATIEQRALSGPGTAGGLFEAGWGYGGYSKLALMQQLLGAASPFEPCYCDWDCHLYEDCCPDFKLVCKQDQSTTSRRSDGGKTCLGRCLETPDLRDGGRECYCDDECIAGGDCCDDKVLLCL